MKSYQSYEENVFENKFKIGFDYPLMKRFT